jgi:hypothetical protein
MSTLAMKVWIVLKIAVNAMEPVKLKAMSKVKRVIIEFNDKIRIFEGAEADKYVSHFHSIHNAAALANVTPFESDKPLAKEYGLKDD